MSKQLWEDESENRQSDAYDKGYKDGERDSAAEIRRLRAELHEAQERCCRDVEELQALWPDDWRRVETLQMAVQVIQRRMARKKQL